jgi:hypothetical protein
MRNFYLVDFCCFCRSAYLIHQILGFPVPVFLTYSHSALLDFFYFLAHKISKSSTWTQYPIRNILRPAAKKKKTFGGSNTPPFTASTKTEKSALIFPAVPVHQGQVLLASIVFDIHYAIPTLYSNRIFLFSQGTCVQFLGITLSLAIANSVFLNQSMSSIESGAIQAVMEGDKSGFLEEFGEVVLYAVVKAISATRILVVVGALVAVLSFGMKRRGCLLLAGWPVVRN